MKKLGGGYTNYINLKYDRSGHVFQGKFKSKLIETDAHFAHISRYIHLNPIDLIGDNWERGDFLSQYKWSSYLDWIGTKNFPSVLDIPSMMSIRGMSAIEYKQFVLEWSGTQYSDVGHPKCFTSARGRGSLESCPPFPLSTPA